VSEQLLWDIVNMSDEYTIVGERVPCAIAVLLLGEGAYALNPVGHEALGLPILAFCPEDEWESWLLDECGIVMVDFSAWLSEHAGEVAAVLDTVLIGNRAEYERLIACVADDKREQFAAEWHNTHRSSMNDIGARAKRLAASLRARETKSGGDPDEHDA